MILYHGSNVDIQNISLSACRPYKDFGRGFYLTDIPEQAERMAERVTPAAISLLRKISYE